MHRLVQRVALSGGIRALRRNSALGSLSILNRGENLSERFPELKTRDWIFTRNNPLPEHIDSLHREDSKVQYSVYQLEVSDTGTKHLQGYVEFCEGLTWHEVKDILGAGTFFTRARGTRESARAYCMKEESRVSGPWEVGVWEENREGESDNQCAYIISGKDTRRCKHRTSSGQYCRAHQRITDSQ